MGIVHADVLWETSGTKPRNEYLYGNGNYPHLDLTGQLEKERGEGWESLTPTLWDSKGTENII